MILFKNYKKEENEKISALRSVVPPEYINHNIMVAQEDDEIIGSCFYEIEGVFCKLNYVYMKTENELIKDALIRTLINAMDLMGVTKIVVKIAGDKSFYAKIGFNPLFFREFMLNLKGEEGDYLLLDTKEFFENMSCSSE